VGATAQLAPMPPREINDSKHWRNRAAEMRVLSNTMTDPEVVAKMLKLANDYDQLADRAQGPARDRNPEVPALLAPPSTLIPDRD
jgi:hypothetical protein